MGRYRKIDPRIHNDSKFKALSERGKLLFFTILTHPHMTALGAMRATEAGLCEEMALGTSGKDAGCPADCPSGRAAGIFECYRRAFRDLIEKDLIKFDPGNACLVIPNFLKYNPPESPSVVTAWNAAGDLIPECDLRDELIENTIKFLQGYGKPDKDSFLKAFSLRPLNKQAAAQTERQAVPQTDGQGAAHQEQEQEQIHPPTPPKERNGSGGGKRKEKTSKSRNTKAKRQLSPYSEEFEQFYENYPNKKGGKEAAWDKWQWRLKNGTLPPFAYLLEYLHRLIQDAEWMREDGRFVPMVTTFLNNGRWTDVDALKSSAAPPQNQPDPNCPHCHGRGIAEKEVDGRMVGGICPCRKRDK